MSTCAAVNESLQEHICPGVFHSREMDWDPLLGWCSEGCRGHREEAQRAVCGDKETCRTSFQKAQTHGVRCTQHLSSPRLCQHTASFRFAACDLPAFGEDTWREEAAPWNMEEGMVRCFPAHPCLGPHLKSGHIFQQAPQPCLWLK